MAMRLTPAQTDRACGTVLGTAVGDALGAPYEFGLAEVGPEGPRMIGGGLGGFAPGEWTDGTMAWAILDVAATGVDLRTDDALTEIGRNFRRWCDSDPPDIGNQTRLTLHDAGPQPTGAAMTATSTTCTATSPMPTSSSAPSEPARGSPRATPTISALSTRTWTSYRCRRVWGDGLKARQDDRAKVCGLLRD